MTVLCVLAGSSVQKVSGRPLIICVRAGRTPAGDWTSDNDGGSGRGGRHQIILGQRWIGDTIRLNIFPDSSHDFDRPAGGEYIVCVRRIKHVNDIDPETIGVESSPLVLDESGRAVLPMLRLDAKGAPIIEHLRIDYPGDVDVFLLPPNSSGFAVSVASHTKGRLPSLFIFDREQRVVLSSSYTSPNEPLIVPPHSVTRYYAVAYGHLTNESYSLMVVGLNILCQLYRL